MKQKKQVSIGLKLSTYNKLKELKETGQSFDGIIQEMMKVYTTVIKETV